jgi:hypothetical protein
VDLVTCATHWLKAAKYHYRQVKGFPTPAEADTILGLFTLTAAVNPALSEVIPLKAQFLNGDDLLGLPR